jgi:TFIIH basal transcription factor complex TTD-A subunit
MVGVLVECEPAIKAIIIMLDRINHNFIIEDLDETHLVVQENMLTLLKQHLESVSPPSPVAVCNLIGTDYGLFPGTQRNPTSRRAARRFRLSDTAIPLPLHKLYPAVTCHSYGYTHCRTCI